MQTYTETITKSRATLKKGEDQLKQSHLILFRNGFHSFYKLNQGENFLCYYAPTPKLADACAEDARKRIKELNLNLTVERGSSLYNSFIVRSCPSSSY
jgi:hypothetical protein